MSNEPKKILAVGASGEFAGLVVPELVRRGAVVRALIHDGAKEAQVRGLGATEVAVADLADRAALDAALEGVDGVFYIAPAFLPHEAEVGDVELHQWAGMPHVFAANIGLLSAAQPAVDAIGQFLRGAFAASPAMETIT